MFTQLSVNEWLELPHETRIKLAEIFSIPKSTGIVTTHGVTTTVLSDGHTYQDLSAITVEKMMNYLGFEVHNPEETENVVDFPGLFQAVLDKIDEELANIPEAVESGMTHDEELLEFWADQLVTIKNKSHDLGLLPHVEEIVRRVFEINKPVAVINTNTNAKRRSKKTK